MRRIFGGRDVWVGISHRFRLVKSKRPLCTNNKPTTTNPNNNGNKVDASLSRYEAYRDLDKLDFMTAAKILFTTPPNKNKFGIDFHLVQLFFVCMPSLAVYLVAQYARYEMRRMEGELEVKKKAEEEAKAKEMELKAAEEKEAGSDPLLREVKTRLGKLEEAVKEIVVEAKKQSGNTIAKKQEDDNEKNQSTTTESEARNSAAEEQTSKGTTGSLQQDGTGAAPVTDATQQNQKATQEKGP